MKHSDVLFAIRIAAAATGMVAGAAFVTSGVQAQTRGSIAMPPIADIVDTCFARTYSPAHLASHRLQKIQRIVLTTVERRGSKPVLAKDVFEMMVGVQQRGSSRWYYKFAECRFCKNGYNCNLESDGGSFNVTDRSDGTVRLATTGSVRMEGLQDSIEFGGDGSDDNIFVLGPAACRKL